MQGASRETSEIAEFVKKTVQRAHACGRLDRLLQLREFLEERKKFLRVEPHHIRRRAAPHRRVAIASRDQREFAKLIPGTKGRERDLLAALGLFHHPGPAGGQDIKRVRLV